MLLVIFFCQEDQQTLHIKLISLFQNFVLCSPLVALYAISAVYFAGVMVRLMLTLTPVVCMLSAIAFSSVFEHYLGDDMKRENPPAEDSSDEDDKRNSGNLYDKVDLSPSMLHLTLDVSIFPVGMEWNIEYRCGKLYPSNECLVADPNL